MDAQGNIWILLAVIAVFVIVLMQKKKE